MLTLPDEYLRAAARHTLPAEHPLFRPGEAPLDYFRRSQRCHAGIGSPESWQERRVFLTARQCYSPGLDAVAGIRGDRLTISRAGDGSELGSCRLPAGCSLLEPKSEWGRGVVAWQPGSCGLALLAVRTGGKLRCVVLLAAWHAQQLSLQEVLIAEGAESFAHRPYLAWSPCSCQLAICSEHTWDTVFIVDPQRTVSALSFALPHDRIWAWSGDSSCLMGLGQTVGPQGQSNVVVVSLAPAQQRLIQLASGYCCCSWALCRQRPCIFFATSAGLAWQDCRTGEPLQIVAQEYCRPHAMACGLSLVVWVEQHEPFITLEVAASKGEVNQLVPLRSIRAGSQDTVMFSGDVAFSPDERHLAVVEERHEQWEVQLYHVISGTQLAHYTVAQKQHDFLLDLAWSANGQELHVLGLDTKSGVTCLVVISFVRD